MDRIHRLNEDEIADALSGKPAEEPIAGCEGCAAEFAAWSDLGSGLRRGLDAQANRPSYFWTRQQARIRERLTKRVASMRWVAAAICVLVLLGVGMIHQGATPTSEIAQTAPSVKTMEAAPADPDDALLQDIQASLGREVPAPLAPAAMLVEEMASNQAQHPKEN